MVVDYHNVNSEIIFYSYSLPKMKPTFENFGGAVVYKFSVLLNSLFVSKSSEDCFMHDIRPF
jgi:hypothetical protein